MRYRKTHLGLALAVSSAALLLLLPGRQDAQKADPVAGKSATPAPGQLQEPVFDLLETIIDIQDVQQVSSLLDVLVRISDKIRAAKGIEFPIVVDRAAFQAADPAAPDIYDAKIMFPPITKKMTVGAALDFALKQVVTRNACFVVKADVIYITTFDAVRVENKLGELVVARFSNRRLTDALDELAKKYGMSIILDQQRMGGGQAENMVSATFRGDMNLAGVLRVLTESSNLKIILLNGGLFVTTPENAEQLRVEARERQKANDPLWPRELPGAAAGSIPQGLGGFFPGQPIPGVINPAK